MRSLESRSREALTPNLAMALARPSAGGGAEAKATQGAGAERVLGPQLVQGKAKMRLRRLRSSTQAAR